ncbi:DUF1801 domain-containing protein [Archangium primigenium]|uniref:DUF1801 domain-containing protein n=1 Tax=[Archangium] primigenium TaxID=2792470 RepID=UPI00195E7B4E|nr:DUF1801 domain-containing protein [Archangium primigenium]
MTESKAKPKARSTSAARKTTRKTATPSRPLKRPAPTTAKKASTGQASGDAASQRIDQRIRELGGWRGETLARMRALIQEAVPEVLEEVKWRGTPVWSLDGILCTGESYTKAVKLTFAQGAKLPDPSGLFNSSLEGNTRRAIDLPEGAKVNARAFKALVKAAVALNAASKKKARPTASKARPVKLLSGGNPQIAKGDGDAPVQAYLAAMPGWKRDVGQRLDALIVRSVPHVRKAVKWNSPLYGTEGGWFLGLHVFARYIKVSFFRGASLRPVPPGPSKDPNTRYLDLHEDDAFDEKQVAAWVKQAAALPGAKL